MIDVFFRHIWTINHPSDRPLFFTIKNLFFTLPERFWKSSFCKPLNKKLDDSRNKIIEKSNFNGKIECEKDPMQFEMISNHGIDPCSDFENMLKSLEEFENRMNFKSAKTGYASINSSQF